MVPTGIDEFIAEHVVGDTVTGRIIDVDMAASTARVELGEGILATSVIPAQTNPEPTTPASGPVDLSQLGSLLSAKWKTDVSAKPKKPVASVTPQKTVTAGQVRSFKLTTIDPTTKRLALELVS